MSVLVQLVADFLNAIGQTAKHSMSLQAITRASILTISRSRLDL